MKPTNNNIHGEDTQCWVACDCRYDDDGFFLDENAENDLSISNYRIVRCPHCGKGYRTEFLVWEYEKDEKDPNYSTTVTIYGETEMEWSND